MAGPKRPYWADFRIVGNVFRTGARSALLPLRSEGFEGATRIYGVVQDLYPPAFPRRLTGWVRVEEWRRGTEKQYLQVVVIAFAPANIPGFENVQVAFLLGGVDSPPLQLRNRRFLPAGPPEPHQGQWVGFAFDLHRDFARTWGRIPRGFEKLRILFEVRYDGRTPDDPPAAADVYYDDLYLGP